MKSFGLAGTNPCFGVCPLKPVASEEVIEEETVTKRLTIVCNAVSGYFASRFNNANMELLKGLDGLDEESPDWLCFQKLREIIDHYSGLQINKTMLEIECMKIKFSSVPPPPTASQTSVSYWSSRGP